MLYVPHFSRQMPLWATPLATCSLVAFSGGVLALDSSAPPLTCGLLLFQHGAFLTLALFFLPRPHRAFLFRAPALAAHTIRKLAHEASAGSPPVGVKAKLFCCFLGAAFCALLPLRDLTVLTRPITEFLVAVHTRRSRRDLADGTWRKAVASADPLPLVVQMVGQHRHRWPRRAARHDTFWKLAVVALLLRATFLLHVLLAHVG